MLSASVSAYKALGRVSVAVNPAAKAVAKIEKICLSATEKFAKMFSIFKTAKPCWG